MKEEICPCLITNKNNQQIEDRCGLNNEIVDGDDCEEFAVSCPCLMTLNNPQPMEFKMINSFNQDYIEKAKEFYKRLK